MESKEELEFFANRFKKWRISKRFSEEDAARYFNVHYKTIRNWERGISRPSLLKVNNVCNELGISITYIYPLKDKSFAEILKQKRKEKGLSRKELSDELGYHVNTIGFWERGEFKPNKYALEDICSFFNLPESILQE
jgi:transcriptional regulator with XRE-family HTH domain